MLDLLANLLFTASACAVLLFTIAAVRNRLVPHFAGFRNRFLLLSLVIIALKVGYVILFVVFRPELVLSPDAYRYLGEIRQIAIAPWDWNPILGSGPDYDATPKMGMSYLYGLILFLHGATASIYAILVINIVVAYITCAVAFLLTLRISSAIVPAFSAMFLTAVYPETLFWNARVLRENLTLLLVTALVYVAVRLFDSPRSRHIVYLVTLTVLLLITRAQLALFLPLILTYHAGAVFVRARGTKVIRSVAVVILLGSLVLAGFGLMRQQIQAVGGRGLFRLTQMGSALPDRFLDNIGSVLSLGARQEYGSLGSVLVPFTLITFVLLVATLVRFRRIFPGTSVHAGLMVFLIALFIAGLAITGLPNIRFRSTVAPLELSLISAACCYYWRSFGFPRIMLMPMRRR